MKKILCIVDSYNWALANRVNALKKYYNNHHFDIKYFGDLNKISFDNYHIVYSLNWPIHGYIFKKISSNRKYRLITSVSSHIGQPSDISFYNLLKQYDAVSLSNNFLYQDFKKRFPKLKIYYTPFGVDNNVFYPTSNASNFSNIFGWVGNHTRSVKRFNIIEEVFSSLNNKFELKVITQNSNLNRKEMAKFYNSIGTLICFSESEGTPNPILEAAACGRNIISTNVGNVPQLVAKSSIDIVNNKSELKNAILKNANDPQLIQKNGDFLKERVQLYWNWDLRAENFKTFLGI